MPQTEKLPNISIQMEVQGRIITMTFSSTENAELPKLIRNTMLDSFIRNNYYSGIIASKAG